jgi:hypothetical protein
VSLGTDAGTETTESTRPEGDLRRYRRGLDGLAVWWVEAATTQPS